MYVICNYIMSHLLLQVPPLESSVVSWANVPSIHSGVLFDGRSFYPTSSMAHIWPLFKTLKHVIFNILKHFLHNNGPILLA